MKKNNRILEYPVAVWGLSEAEFESIQSILNDRSFIPFMASLLKVEFPGFPIEDQGMVEDAGTLYLLIAADRGFLTSWIERKKKGLL